MTQADIDRNEIIEMAIQGHASTRDAIKWAMNQAAAKEREACAKLCDEYQDIPATEPRHCAQDIRARGEA